MPKITFISAEGVVHAVEAPEGASVMEAAVQNMVPGIDADCGGQCACATCHVYVDDAWFARTGGPQSDTERQMLDLTDNRQDNSRLACQIKITGELDGLVLRTPAAQH
jgi:ferredoxin, 2Fe-2S